MDDLFAISSWQEQLNGMGKHSWNSIGNFEYGSNAYHCSTINNTNDLAENKCCNHASRVSSMAPYLTGKDSVEKESLLSPNEHQGLLMYDHRNIMHQYDPLLSAQVNHFEKHQTVSAATVTVSSRPFTSGPTPETILPIEPSYLSKQLWSDEAAPWRRHRALDASNRGQGRVEMRVGQHSQPQINSTLANGNVKPRTRARRGQATDPHSIAERHRRERIADGMKKLQELVPNISKVDKGSMLDDIISYVKFLQLQTTVLNLNKLGSTGAVAPLLAADICSDEICHQRQTFPESPIFSGQSSVEAGMAANTNADYSSKIIKAEEEVVKLMEVDMSSAMRFLQKKGLCLMPISLAAVISSKDSSSACSNDAKER